MISCVEVTTPWSVLNAVVLVVVSRSPSRLRSNSTESCSPSSTPNSSQVVQLDFGDQHLDHDLRRLRVQLLDQLLDFFEESRRGAEDQAVADRFRHDDDFALDLLEGTLDAGQPPAARSVRCAGTR